MSGEIDLASSDRLSRAVRDAIFEADAAVRLDLLQVTFIDSTGISVLVRARQLAVEEGVELRVVRASARVESVLDLMGLKAYFM